MDTSKIKAFLVKPVYKKLKVWHLLIILGIIGAASGKKKKGSGSGNYDDSCCCVYYNNDGEKEYDRIDFEECMQKGGKCLSDMNGQSSACN